MCEHYDKIGRGGGNVWGGAWRDPTGLGYGNLVLDDLGLLPHYGVELVDTLIRLGLRMGSLPQFARVAICAAPRPSGGPSLDGTDLLTVLRLAIARSTCPDPHRLHAGREGGLCGGVQLGPHLSRIAFR